MFAKMIFLSFPISKKMGIKHFFYWFKRNFAEQIYKLKPQETFEKLSSDEKICNENFGNIDTCLIDMNGIFHTCAQKTFEYGSFKPQTLLKKPIIHKSQELLERNCFQDICELIEKIVRIIRPKRYIVLCVDGPAPLSKQNQQRQRRFVSARDRGNETEFDSNCITPGTKFMDRLTEFIDWFIRKKLSSEDELWKNLDVIFSTEKTPGEGEHKLINYVRKHGLKDYTYCMYGMDADLIMLGLATQLPNFYILREEPKKMGYDAGFEYYVVSLKNTRKKLCDIMRWKHPSEKFIEKRAITDFILMCFMVGNDFLPNIPAIEIIEGGIEYLIESYIHVGSKYGHLTKNGKLQCVALAQFFEKMSVLEAHILQRKLSHKRDFFPDELLEECAGDANGMFDIEKYRGLYYTIKFGQSIAVNTKEKEKETESKTGFDEKTVCYEYLRGIQWVLSYYTSGVPDWRWRFPYHYAPFAYTLSKHTSEFRGAPFHKLTPNLPFVQLLSVLPPRSAELLPSPLNSLISDSEGVLHKFCPFDFYVDVSGKRQAWEGIVLLPMINVNLVEEECAKLIKKVNKTDRKRNNLEIESRFYTNSTGFFTSFSSPFGDFTCQAEIFPIDV